MKLKKILSIFIVLLILSTTLSSINAADDISKIDTKDTKIAFDGNDVTYDGKVIGNITNVSSIEEVEDIIQDKNAIQEAYHEGMEYLAEEGQYYVFEANGSLYVMFIEESSVDIAADCKTLCGNNHEGSYFDKGDVPGATDANGFELDIRDSWMI